MPAPSYIAHSRFRIDTLLSCTVLAILLTLIPVGHAADKPQLVEAYGKLPLSFEVNQGQTDAQVAFLSRGRGYTLFLTPNEAVLALHKPAESDTGHMKDLPFTKAQRQDTNIPVGDVLRMRLIGANPAPQVVGLAKLPGKVNYFIGNDQKKWRTNIATYAKVKYERVYEGIDLVYYGNQRQLEYDFIVGPGADPESIILGFQGAEKLTLDTQGNLILHAAGGKVILNTPVIYQVVNGIKQNIPGQYVFKAKDYVGFQVTAYDASIPLVIDPTLIYSTYLGGSALDRGQDIAVDSSGNAYVIGITRSTNFPTTAGASQTTKGCCADVFVTKLNAAGSALVYSTFLGGNVNDGGTGIAVDSAGNAYLTGNTGSTDFPTVNPIPPFGSSRDGNGDAFVAKLNATGSTLVYSTYLGGGSTESGTKIAVDSSGNAYVVGSTKSTDFPTTTGAFQAGFQGGTDDAFVTKLNPAGSALVYSTFLGGNLFDGAGGIALDSSDNAYVTGFTASTNFPTTTGAFQTAFQGNGDAFVTKLNAAGSALVYSTYLGGTGQDSGSGDIALDSSANAYVTGNTNSADFPTTTGAFETAFQGGIADAFVTKLNAAGSALVYSTYLGGSLSEGGNGIALDSSENAYVIGNTESTDFPTAAAFQPTKGAITDAFVTKLNAAGSALVYSTFLGGDRDDTGFSIAVDSSGDAYVTAYTVSTDFPTTTGAFQITPQGSLDAYVAKIGEPPPLICVEPPSEMVSWWPGDGDATDIQGNNDGSFPAATFVAGKVNNAFSFSGSVHVSIPWDTSLDIQNEITVDAWIKPEFAGRPRAGGITDSDVIYSRDIGSPSPHPHGQHQLSVLMDPAGFGGQPLGTPQVALIINGASAVLNGTTVVPDDGQYHHLAYTYNGFVIRLYLDGVQTDSLGVSGPMETPGIMDTPGTMDAFIGHRVHTVIDSLADIDEVELFDRALSPTQIQGIFAAGSEGKCKGVTADITKVLDFGADPIGIYGSVAEPYTFTITYTNSPLDEEVVITDIVRAEFEIILLSASDGDAIHFQNLMGISSTLITWTLPAQTNCTPGCTLMVEIETVENRGRGHGKKSQTVFKPTSCGTLPINDGATAFTGVDGDGDGIPDDIVVGPSNPLEVEAVDGTKQCEVPKTVSGLSVTTGATGELVLDWDDNGDAALTGYNIYRSTTPGDCTPTDPTPCIAIANGVSPSDYTDTGLTPTVMYHYVVKAVNPVGESTDSKRVSQEASGTAP